MVDEVVAVEETETTYDSEFDDMFGSGDATVVAEELPETEEVVAEEAAPAQDELEAGEPVADFTPPPVTRDPYDWINGLPEEQREMAMRLKHEALSDRGRVSALTRKNYETEQELARVRSTVTPAGEEADVTNAQQRSEKLRQLQEDYPELGKQLTEIWSEQEATLRKEVSDQLAPLKEAQTADAKASEQAQLEQAAADIFNTKETGTYWKDVVQSDDFSAWLQQQPAFIQTTARESNQAQDGIDVLRMYENDYQAELAKIEGHAQDVTTQDATSRGDQLKAKRRQRRATTVSPASRPAGTDTEGNAGDYDSTFNAMWGSRKK